MEDHHGYDASFVNEVSDHMKCVVCHMVLKQPVQIMGCGHRFCKMCFERMKTYAQRMSTELCCPIDRNVINVERVFEDVGIARMIGDLQVKCGNHENNCDWMGELRNLQEHELNCAANKAKKQKLDCEKMDDALMKEMMTRLQRCEQKIEEKDDVIKALKIINTELQKEMKTAKDLNDLRQERIQKQVDDLKKKNQSLENKIAYQSAKGKGITKIEGEVKKLRSEIQAASNHLNSKIEGDVKKLQTEIQAAKSDLNSKMMLQAMEDRAHVENLERVVFCLDSQNNKVIKLKWVLENYQAHSKENEYRSPVFYTEIDGYQFQLMAQWRDREDWEQKPKGIGLYLCLLRGSSRNLKPFKMVYTLDILNKEGANRSCTITQSKIDECREKHFTIHPDKSSVVCLGFLTDNHLLLDYIHNDMLHITCTLYPY